MAAAGGWLLRAARAVVYGAILALLPAVAVARRYDPTWWTRTRSCAGTPPPARYQGPPFLLTAGIVLFVLAVCALAVV
jgi:hypothetical protein